jgi:hypothetical protein
MPTILKIWACPYGSGYPLQVLASLRAFRFYPSRNSFRFKFGIFGM